MATRERAASSGDAGHAAGAARTRRRGAALEAAILDAGWQQLAESGFGGLTFEAVAASAHTGKAALYRRWPDKEALLLAVLHHHGFGAQTEPPNTGSLRDDVLAQLRMLNRQGDEMASFLSIVLGAHFSDEITITPAELRVRLLFGERSRAMEAIIDQAVERGEVPADGLPSRVVSLPGDLVRYEMIMSLAKVPDSTIVGIVDTVFMPLVAAIGRHEQA